MQVIGATVRRSVPQDACYFAFEPAWGLVAGRLPSGVAGSPPVVDVYATMLLEERGSRRRHANAQIALRSRSAQRRIREIVAGCNFLSLGQRGDLQLAPRTRAWIDRRWVETPATAETGVDLWRLRQSSENW
jgi:hypothetical protein